MMVDGAHLGMNAQQALEAVLGGKQSTEAEEAPMDDAAFAAYIRAEPQGEPADYAEAARHAAHYLLRYLEAHPDQQYWPLSNQYDWDGIRANKVDFSDEAARQPYLLHEGVWDHVETAYPALRTVGLTGFMAGWAFNAARKVRGWSPLQWGHGLPAVETTSMESTIC